MLIIIREMWRYKIKIKGAYDRKLYACITG